MLQLRGSAHSCWPMQGVPATVERTTHFADGDDAVTMQTAFCSQIWSSSDASQSAPTGMSGGLATHVPAQHCHDGMHAGSVCTHLRLSHSLRSKQGPPSGTVPTITVAQASLPTGSRVTAVSAVNVQAASP